MIPVTLTIEGLYSYQERQTIDFSELTNAGLFGIFGAVGSGKSTILEAISFALYGDTERLNSREKRSYNMMNLKSNRMYIAFDFYNHENELFRVTREFSRNSKRFEDVKAGNVVFYEWKNNEWFPLEHTDAEQIIGLSYSNFKRTIIIPQGQFKEFLELGPSERTAMMKEIFQLERFDLFEKASRLNAQNNQEKALLEGQLKGYEAVSREDIDAKKEASINLKQQYAEQQKHFDKINEEFQRLKALKQDFDTLSEKKTAFSRLEQQEPVIAKQEENLQLFERVSKVFGQLLKDIATATSVLNTKQEELNKIRQEKLRKEEDLKSVEQQFQEITSLFEQLSKRKTEENDWEQAIRILHLTGETEQLSERLQKGKAAVEKAENEEKVLQQQLQGMEREIALLKSKKIDSQVLIAAGNWFSKIQQLNENCENQKLKIKQKEKEIQDIEAEFKTNEIVPETFESTFQAQQETLKTKQRELEAQKSALEVQQKLAHYSNTLQNGVPCPLCGALEHPDIAKADDVSAELKSVLQRLEELKQTEISWNDRGKLFERLADRKSQLQHDLKQLESHLKEIEESIHAHHQLFEWKEFDAQKPELFSEKQQESLLIERQTEEKNRQLEAIRAAVENQRMSIEKYKKALEGFTLELTAKKSEIETNEKNLKILDRTAFVSVTKEESEKILNDLKIENQRIEEQHKLISERRNELQKESAVLDSQVEVFSQQLKSEKDKNAELNNELQAKLQQQGFTSQNEVEVILNRQLDAEAERKEIQDFRIQLETLRNAIADLEKKFETVVYSEERFGEETEKWQSEREKLMESNDRVVKAEMEVNRLERAFEEKRELLEKFDGFRKREEQLNVMCNLFKGAGFVQYVSSVYLKQLCDMANVRFHRMTRNQLSLHLNSDHNFEIIDYLNEGKSRSVKTLSGGQSFQVSLSLALALAESVQANAKADRNFFFIDEGFGTQDPESVNIIFETLLNLNKENKIVGIISHVEELKERMPKSLRVENDPETGSKVSSER